MSANVMFIDYETSIKSRKEHDPNLTIVIHMVHPQIACDG